ncbi:MAG: ABC transporter ATP-binding protein, partial [Thaumarchaeota archaeon]|nr:ABC transporter ATP-binding protein [Nitrososphaerota archaeon]
MALLEVRNVEKDFGGLVALKDVSFKIDEGEIVGLIGANGAGKSTIFNIITGLLQPTAGSILFEEKDITGLKPHDVVKLGIARTFQSVRPFLNYSVEQNIRVGAMFGRTASVDLDSRVEEVIKVTGLDSKRDTLVRSVPIEQRKLVEVARALASTPKLLMLDEPMAGLNPTETGGFIELVRRVNENGVTVLVVEHVMKAVMTLSRRIIVLHAGQKLAEGTP